MLQPGDSQKHYAKGKKPKGLQIVWFCLYDILEKAKL